MDFRPTEPQLTNLDLQNDEIYEQESIYHEEMADDDGVDEYQELEDFPSPRKIPKSERVSYAAARYAREKKNYDRVISSLGPKEKKKIKKPSYQAIASKYNISATAVQRRYDGQTRHMREVREKDQLLTPGEEKALVKWILQLEAWNFPPTVERMKRMAQELMRKRKDFREIGIHWPDKFRRRHPEVTTRWCKPINRHRANNFTHQTVSDWFELLQNSMDEKDIQKEDSYNMDEKGFALGLLGSEKCFCSKETIELKRSEPGNTDWASVLECISADGRLLPPFIIFKGKVFMESWIEELVGQGKIGLSRKGWTNNSLGFEWFQEIFEPWTKATQKGEYRMLLVDGHSSHITGDVIQFCVNHKILLICLPSHTTHELQPLDVSYFLPLANKYRRLLGEQFNMWKSENVDKPEFIKLYQEARDIVAKPSTITGAWMKSGLFPLNPDLKLDKIRKKSAEDLEKTQIQRPLTPPEVLLRSSSGVEVVAPIQTPATQMQFNSILEKIQDNHQTEHYIKKLGKAIDNLLSEKNALQITSDTLIQSQENANQRSQRSKKQLGKGQVMGREVLEETRLAAEAKDAADAQKKAESDAKKTEKERRKAEKAMKKVQEQTNRKTNTKDSANGNNLPLDLSLLNLGQPLVDQSTIKEAAISSTDFRQSQESINTATKEDAPSTRRNGRGKGKTQASLEITAEQDEAVEEREELKKTRSGRTVKPKKYP